MIKYLLFLGFISTSLITSTSIYLDSDNGSDVDSDLYYSKSNGWTDYYSSSYLGSFSVLKSDYNRSKYYRENRGSDVSSYSELYRNMTKFDVSKLSSVSSELYRIKKAKNLSRSRNASMIVSLVQDIPYCIVTHNSCSYDYYSSDGVKEMIDAGIKCNGSVTTGVYSPVEFIKHFEGDCDTRTVFLYTVLKKQGYDVVILNSDVYAHSMLGINLPSSGRYKYYNSKRYYFWETTAVGYEIGMLPAEISNTNNWFVALN